jgi:hypothetical protein
VTEFIPRTNSVTESIDSPSIVAATLLVMPRRYCANPSCRAALSSTLRQDVQFCSVACRVAVHRAKIASRALDQWKDEVRAKLADTGAIHCQASKILAQCVAEVVKTHRAVARKQRLDWLITEAHRHYFNFAFTIVPGGIAYQWRQRRLRFAYSDALDTSSGANAGGHSLGSDRALG